MIEQLLPALRVTLLMTVVTGLLYPGLVTALCQVVLPGQANGSLVNRDGRVVGSALIGQPFAAPQYFHPRPSAAGSGYDASVSSGSNLGPTSQKLADRVKAGAAEFRQKNGASGPLPADAVTASASGLDPHISPATAAAQAARVAGARGVSPAQVRRVVARHTEGRDFGFLGEPRVNVLAVNLALDRELGRK